MPPIQEKSLVAKINRRLRPHLETLSKSRGLTERREFGDYFHKDLFRNRILQTHVNPEQFWSELNAR